MRRFLFDPRQVRASRVVVVAAMTLLMAVAKVDVLGGAAAACSTPVYRYAMYNWQRSAYRVYYFHAQKPPTGDARSNAAIARHAKSDGAAANVELLDVPVTGSATDPLAAIPEEFRDEAAELLAAATKLGLPRYVVVSPHGTELFWGKLTAADVAALVDSPVRAKICAMLSAAQAGVLVLVTGKDEAANRAAQQAVEAVLRNAAAGAISLPVSDDVAGTPPSENEPTSPGAPAAGKRMEVGFVKIARDDPAERWLVRALLAVEDELAERAEPMVFGVYGRGRVNPPCIGKGINAEQLTAQVRFMLGPCACTVKHENAGSDLLTRYDWPAAAMAMAERFGSETGNEHLLGDAAFPGLFPDVVPAPSTTASDDQAVGKTAQPAGETSARPDHPHSAVPPTPNAQATDSATPSTPSETQAAQTRPAVEQGGPIVRNLGIGVAVALGILALASLMMLRPR